MRRPVLFWATSIGTLAAFDYWCATNAVEGDSLSECTRALLRTDTLAGGLVFVGAWAGLTAWFVPHILRPTIVRAIKAVDDNLDVFTEEPL